jgi:hypothetical protein
MYLRFSTRRRGGKSYRYVQLVESFRRPDGVPSCRVIRHLGVLSDTEVANFKAALAANRVGELVSVARAPAKKPGSTTRPPKPLANLRYLDLAVLLSLWRESGLAELFSKLLPRGANEVAPADVLAALVLQRCVEPRSKLHAERWFPQTALPELFAVSTESFHNTRIHRVLDELDRHTPALLDRLPTLYLEGLRRPAFSTFFLDVTDAIFVGQGPGLAVRGRTKEGLIERKIGIVLLCNELGYPLRWRVVAGNASDNKVMTAMLGELAKTRWIQSTPVVCDRAMGKTATLRELAATGLHFLTAVTTPEFTTYAPKLPAASFASLELGPGPEEEALAALEAKATENAHKVGLEKVSSTLWVYDGGLVEVDHDPASDLEQATASELGPARALEIARGIEQAVREGRAASFNAAGRALGLKKGVVQKYRYLTALPQDAQEAIARGEAEACFLAELIKVARLPDLADRAAAFAVLCAQAQLRRRRRSRITDETPAAAAPTPPLRVRVVVYFNPERFAEQRLNARRRREAIDNFATELNQRLASPRARHSRASIAAAIDRRLRRDDLLEAYDSTITECEIGGRTCFQVTLKPIAAEWKKRSLFHGFMVVVGHPELKGTAAELCQLYRAKDLIEKDFQVIKSVIKLRPIRHQTEEKVSAHVTLCMLALLLERLLEHKLERKISAQVALETFAACRLNQYRGAAPESSSLYALTEATSEQLQLLRRLGFPLLADDDDLAARMTPRRAVPRVFE